MKRIEPGMLCLVVGGYNKGRSCTTVRRLKPGDLIEEISGGCYYCTRDTWLVNGPSIGDGIHGGFGTVYERNLMPISGGDKLEDLETKEDLETAT